MTDAASALRDTPFAAVTVEQGVAVVTIDRPERRNALHPDAHRSLHKVFDTLPSDPSIRAVIVTGR
ncbi:MAG: enoyl-CoA hydratase-related protein, partial [Caulobacterales bacterium]